MKLYRKKLDSLEALKREKIRLRYERMHTKASDLNPLAEMGGKTGSTVATTGLLGTLAGLFAAKNNMQIAMAVGKPLLKALRKRHAKHEAAYVASALSYKKKKSSLLKRLVTEIAVNYAIGKVVQLSVLSINALRKRRKLAKIKAKMQG